LFDDFLKSREEIFLKIRSIIAEFLEQPEDNMALKTCFDDLGFGARYLIKELEYEFNVDFLQIIFTIEVI
jgi:acyl carrier protein